VSKFILNSLHYSRGNEDFHDRAGYFEDPFQEFHRASTRLCRSVGQRLRDETERLDLSRVAACVACTTGLSPIYADVDEYNRHFRRHVFEAAGIEPEMIVNAYECAGWGYTLRHLEKYAQGREVLILIMDLNLPFYRSSVRNSIWENSGFGLTILNISIQADETDDLLTGHTRTANGYFEYVRATKAFADRYADAKVSMPFFPATQRRVISQYFGARRLPDLHDEYGHCFGSDPWIGLVRHFQATPETADRAEILVSSFALAGYYCAARISTSPQLRLSSRETLLAA
jgi:hypothetical protein